MYREQLAVAHVDPTKVAWARELSRRYPPRLDATTGVPNVLRTRQPEIYSDITDDMLVAGAVDDEHLRLSRQLGLRSALIVPLVSPATAIGALTLVSAESGRRYSEHDLPLATELARRAAVAVEHARLHRQAVAARAAAQRAMRSADRLYSLTARLTGAATPTAVADAVLAEAAETFGAERGTVSLIEEDGDTTRAAGGVRLRRGHTATVAIVLAAQHDLGHARERRRPVVACSSSRSTTRVRDTPPPRRCSRQPERRPRSCCRS